MSEDVDATAWWPSRWSSDQTSVTLQPDVSWGDWRHECGCDTPAVPVCSRCDSQPDYDQACWAAITAAICSRASFETANQKAFCLLLHNTIDDVLMTSTAPARRAVWNLIFKTDTFKRFNSSFMLQNLMQKFAHFLINCWTVLRIKFFKLPHPYNAIKDNVLRVHFLSGHSVLWKANDHLSTGRCYRTDRTFSAANCIISIITA